MTVNKALAINDKGDITFCSVPSEDRGKGRCNHIAHQEEGESVEDFISKINSKIKVEGVEEVKEIDTSKMKPISQGEIDSYAKRIDEIAGVKVTDENLHEVLLSLPPEKVRQIQQIGFEAAPEFSLPISNEDYLDETLNTHIYFSEMPGYGIAGKANAIKQMFDVVGEVPSEDGVVDIQSNYKYGLTPSQEFEKQFSARAASIAKTVSVAQPGYIARKLFYALSDIEVKDDCGDSSKGILGCKVPGGVCEKCLKASGVEHYEAGTLLGSVISTNLSEPGTQLVMRHFHSGGQDLIGQENRDVINKTYDGFSSSYIIREAKEAKTTEEAREIMYESLKAEYEKEGISMDDYNLAIIAKKLTSYKRGKGGTRYVKDDEKCDIVSIGSIGNNSNPLKAAELQSPYRKLTKPGEYEMEPDAATEIIL